MPRVEIVIGKGGKTVIDVKNAQGTGCKKVTEQLGVRMGLTPLEETLKPEYHLEAGTETVTREYA